MDAILVLFFIEWSFSINCFLSNHIDYQVVNNEWTEYSQYKAEMSLGYQIWVGKQKCGGHNLPLPVGIGLTETSNSRWAKAHPTHPLATSL